MALPFSEWLQARMNQRGAGNNKLARYLGVSPTTVSRWRSGEDIPDPPNCHKIAAYFEREVEEVMAVAQHLERTDEQIKRLGLIAEFKVAQRRQKEQDQLLARIGQELFGTSLDPQETPE